MNRELSEVEVKCILMSVAWRRQMTMDNQKEMHEKLMLSMMKQIAGCEVKSSCALLKSKAERKVMLRKRWNHRPLGKMAWGEEGGEGVQGM